MSTRESILGTVRAFCTQYKLGRRAFGLLAVGDRDFIRHLEVGKPITLGRIERGEAFMAAVNADPARLSVLLKEAGLEPKPRSRGGAALEAGESPEKSREAEGGGSSGHDDSVPEAAAAGHREGFSPEVDA